MTSLTKFAITWGYVVMLNSWIERAILIDSDGTGGLQNGVVTIQQ